MTALSVLIGVGFGAGLLLVIDGFTREPAVSTSRLTINLTPEQQRRGLQALAGAVLLGALTRWPIGIAAGAAIGWWISDLVGGKAAREREIARTEAIATWTEMLRDTMSGAHGLEETIITSASVAPDAIKPEVVRLATFVRREPLTQALQRFAVELAHPTGDLVVAALSLAANGSARELGELLGTLGVAARDETGMHLRVDAARARMRTAVRVISGCTVATAVGLAVLNRSYLAVYGDAAGQGMLALIAVIWGLSLRWMTRMSRFAAPERFLATEVTA